jgi:hypothetical protein
MCHTGKAHAARWIVYNSTNSDSLKHQLRTASPVNYPITKLANFTFFSTPNQPAYSRDSSFTNGNFSRTSGSFNP